MSAGLDQPVLAIIGAGPLMGRAIARTFGEQGFRIALLSRSPEKLAPLTTELCDQGIDAAGFTVNVLDRATIVSGLKAVKDHFGRIDILEYSPADPTLPSVSVTALTHKNVQVMLDFHVHGAVAAVNEVLPDMLERGSGTILFTSGASTINPQHTHAMFGNVSPATAWVRNWAIGLHAALAPKGVQVAHVAIGAWLGEGGTSPELVAPLYWELHTNRDEVEKVFIPE